MAGGLVGALVALVVVGAAGRAPAAPTARPAPRHLIVGKAVTLPATLVGAEPPGAPSPCP